MTEFQAQLKENNNIYISIQEKQAILILMQHNLSYFLYFAMCHTKLSLISLKLSYVLPVGRQLTES